MRKSVRTGVAVAAVAMTGALGFGTLTTSANAQDAGGSRDARDTLDARASQPAFVSLGYAKKAWSKCKDTWVCLYSKENGKGRVLKYNAGGWQNLDQYSFANKTSSIWNRMEGWGASVHLATKNGGYGKVVEYDPGKARKLGKYNNTFNSINP